MTLLWWRLVCRRHLEAGLAQTVHDGFDEFIGHPAGAERGARIGVEFRPVGPNSFKDIFGPLQLSKLTIGGRQR
jgi:hypothetical protein